MSKPTAVIFGAGSSATRAFADIQLWCEPRCFADNDAAKQGGQLFDLPILSPRDAFAQPHDLIVIASMFYREIARDLIRTHGTNPLILRRGDGAALFDVDAVLGLLDGDVATERPGPQPPVFAFKYWEAT